MHDSKSVARMNQSLGDKSLRYELLRKLKREDASLLRNAIRLKNRALVPEVIELAKVGSIPKHARNLEIVDILRIRSSEGNTFSISGHFDAYYTSDMVFVNVRKVSKVGNGSGEDVEVQSGNYAVGFRFSSQSVASFRLKDLRHRLNYGY